MGKIKKINKLYSYQDLLSLGVGEIAKILKKVNITPFKEIINGSSKFYINHEQFLKVVKYLNWKEINYNNSDYIVKRMIKLKDLGTNQNGE